MVMKLTGFALMHITALMAVWANGRKTTSMVIHKGKSNGVISRESGPILHTTQEKAWVQSSLIINWIDVLFSIVNISSRKCIVWDSCWAHISGDVKQHCAKRNIELIVIPGGMTPYLQAGDIGIYQELKDNISTVIDHWKRSDHVQYTKGGNPKPPQNEMVRSWVLDSWRQVSVSTVKNSILASGFHTDYKQWHIAKHDIYVVQFLTA